MGLAIYNEQVSNLNVGTGTAFIEWDTNLYSTSQVIYGPVSGGPYTLNPGLLPNLGYPLGSPEYPTKVMHHAVFLTGLSPSTTYVYRVVSRASPPTVSAERQFTTLALASPPQTSSSLSGQVPTPPATTGSEDVGSSGGAGGTGTGVGTSSEEAATATPTLQLASALFGLPAGLLEFFQSFGLWLLLLILAILIARFVWRHYRNSSY